MIDQSSKKVENFVKYLKKFLLDEGYTKLAIQAMSNDEILNIFRVCADCGDEICTKDQQMHAILEFDSPARVFQVLYEEDSLAGCEKENNEDIKEINFDIEDLCEECFDSCIDFLEDNDTSKENFCDKCFEAFMGAIHEEASECDSEHQEIPENIEDDEIIRGKWIFEGASSITEIIDNTKNLVEYLQQLKNGGFELAFPVKDDYGYLSKRKD